MSETLAVIGKMLAALGLVMAVVGVGLWLASRWAPAQGLPGDLVVRRPGLTVYVPIATALLLSLVLTLLLNLLGWLRR